MNGSENGYAAALFFALISLGALLKIDDEVGLIVGAVCALLSAVNLLRALIKAAQANEEDHQRIEIQFQQLRNKFGETSSTNVEAMSSVSEAAQLLQENLQIIRVRLAELDNLTQLAKSAEDIRLTIAGMDENSSALNAELEKILLAVQAQAQEKAAPDSEAITALADELKKLNAIEETNKASLQTVLKLLQLIGQMLKTPSYAKEFDKINASMEKLIVLNGGDPKPADPPPLDEHDLTLLKKIAEKINIKQNAPTERADSKERTK